MQQYRVPETRLSGYNADGAPLSPPPRVLGYDAAGNPRTAEVPGTSSSLKEIATRAAESLRALVGGLTTTNAQAAAPTEVLCPGAARAEPAPGEPIVATLGGAASSPPAGLDKVRQWATCKVFWGVFLLGHAWFNFQIYKKFTPVYTPVKCGHQSGTLDDFQLVEGGIHVGLKISVECENPNPYQIQIVASTPGKVYIGPLVDMLETGHLKVMPGSNMDEFGRGTVHVEMSQELYGRTSQLLVHHLMYDHNIPVWLELSFDVGVYMSFGLRSWGAAMPYKKYCGMNVGGLLVSDHGAKSHLGPLVCGNRFEDLAVPDVGAKEYETNDGQMGFKASQVAKKEVEDGTKAKDWSLGVVIAGSLLIGVLLLTWQTLLVMGYIKPKPPAQNQGVRLDKVCDGLGQSAGRDADPLKQKERELEGKQGDRGAYSALQGTGSCFRRTDNDLEASQSSSKDTRGPKYFERLAMDNMEGKPLMHFTHSEEYIDSSREARDAANDDSRQASRPFAESAYLSGARKESGADKKKDGESRSYAQGLEEGERTPGRSRGDSGRSRGDSGRSRGDSGKAHSKR